MQVFSYSDLIEDGNKIDDFQSLYIDENTADPIILARMIIGSVKISHLYRGIEFDQTTNCLSSFYSDNDDAILTRLVTYISDDLEVSDISDFYNDAVNRRKNKKYYNRLLNEFSHYFYHTSKQNYTTAFIYIYRILEVISFAFPLIYASQTDDFKGTYGYLKDYFSENKGQNKGELGFFKSFVTKTFATNPIRSTSVDFDFSLIHRQDSKEVLFNKLKSICGDRILHPDTTDFDQLSVNFTDVGSFLITVRNRFFHLFNRGDSNLESEEIFDADALFEILNPKCIGWISLIYFEVLKNSLTSIR